MLVVWARKFLWSMKQRILLLVGSVTLLLSSSIVHRRSRRGRFCVYVFRFMRAHFVYALFNSNKNDDLTVDWMRGRIVKHHRLRKCEISRTGHTKKNTWRIRWFICKQIKMSWAFSLSSYFTDESIKLWCVVYILCFVWHGAGGKSFYSDWKHVC